MTTITVYKGKSVQVGPLDVWPLRWEGLSSIVYEVPPKIDQLIFREFSDGPQVDCIEVENPTATPFLIPEGWVVGAQLMQTRVFNRATHIAAKESVLADVSCVEKGRWSIGANAVDGGRAPLTVFAAGWEHNAEDGTWRLNRNTRQTRVWNQVSRQESRTGERPTNSLEQVMREDSMNLSLQRSIQESARSKVRVLSGQNGLLISYEGIPLLMEAHASERAFENTLHQTIRAVSFDVEQAHFCQTNEAEVSRFIRNARIDELHFLSNHDWAILMAGGTNGIDTQASVDQQGRLIHATVMNRNHRILLEV